MQFEGCQRLLRLSVRHQLAQHVLDVVAAQHCAAVQVTWHGAETLQRASVSEKPGGSSIACFFNCLGCFATIDHCVPLMAVALQSNRGGFNSSGGVHCLLQLICAVVQRIRKALQLIRVV